MTFADINNHMTALFAFFMENALSWHQYLQQSLSGIQLPQGPTFTNIHTKFTSFCVFPVRVSKVLLNFAANF